MLVARWYALTGSYWAACAHVEEFWEDHPKLWYFCCRLPYWVLRGIYLALKWFTIAALFPVVLLVVLPMVYEDSRN